MEEVSLELLALEEKIGVSQIELAEWQLQADAKKNAYVENSKKIYEALCNIMSEITPVEKKEQGDGVPYKFRSIYGILNMIQPLMAKFKVYIRPEVLEKTSTINEIEKSYWDKEAKGYKTKKQYESHVMVKVKYSFVTVDGSHDDVIVEGEGVDYGDKALNKAMTSALKNALQQMFAIPTDDMSDSEYDDPELSNKGKPAQKANDENQKDEPKNIPAEQAESNPLKTVEEAFAYFRKRINELDNIFALKNWGKKHSAEIKQLPAELYQQIRTLYAEREVSLELLALAEKIGVSHFDLKALRKSEDLEVIFEEAFKGNNDAITTLKLNVNEFIRAKSEQTNDDGLFEEEAENAKYEQ